MSSFAPASISTTFGKNDSEPPPDSELMESEVEDEVDQLESDTDAEAPTAPKAPPVLRPPGKTLLPANRVDNIIQADGVTGSLALSKEGQFVLSVATEGFIKRMVEAGLMKAKSERRSTVSFNDMAYTTQQYQEFMFLEDTIPAPIPLSEALQLRREKEQEFMDDDPAMASAPTTNPYPSIAPTPSTTQSAPPKTKTYKSKNAQSSGQDQPNGHTNTSIKREKKPEQSEKSSSKRKEKDGSSSTKERSKSSAASTSTTKPSTSPPKSSASATSTSNRPKDSKDDMDVEETKPSVGQGQDPNRPGQAGSSPSGLSQVASGSFDQENPGRTIYSD